MKRALTFLAWPLLVVPQFVYWSGALMNQVAMVANDGLMPVLWNSQNPWSPDDTHSVMTHGTHLKLICDWINLHSAILSPGDVLLNLGDLTIGPLFWAWLSYILFRAFLDESDLF